MKNINSVLLKTKVRNSILFSSLLLLNLFSINSVIISKADASVTNKAIRPLDIRSQSPLHGLRYTAAPKQAYALEKDKTEFTTSTDISSIWANSSDFILDFNMIDFKVGFDHGLGDGWTSHVSLTERRVINAHLDQATISFHKLMGLGQDGRTEVPKHQTVISVPKYNIHIEGFQNTTFSRPLVIGLAKEVYSDNKSAYSVSIYGQTETKNSAWKDAGGLDLSLQTDAQWRWSKLSAFNSFAISRLDQEDFYSVPLRKELWMASFGLGWQNSRQGEVVVQYLINKGAAKDVGELTKRNHELSMGYRWNFASWSAELAVTENLFHFYNSPDIAFHGNLKLYI